jgi:hypothetical protein
MEATEAAPRDPAIDGIWINIFDYTELADMVRTVFEGPHSGVHTAVSKTFVIAAMTRSNCLDKIQNSTAPTTCKTTVHEAKIVRWNRRVGTGGMEPFLFNIDPTLMLLTGVRSFATDSSINNATFVIDAAWTAMGHTEQTLC